MTTWLEASKLPDGSRVRFVHDHDIFPEALVRAGTECRIMENSLNEGMAAMLLLPDDMDLQRKLESWGGVIYLAPSQMGADWNDECPFVPIHVHDWKPTDNWLIDRCAICGEERA